jgi:hypothetical protein
VVGHDIDNVSEPVDVECGTERVVVLLGPELRVESPVIADVVTVPASGIRFEMRRAVTVGHTEVCQVGHHVTRLAKTKVAVQLQAVAAHRTVRGLESAHTPLRITDAGRAKLRSR